jgi:hypothetical protein
VETANWSHIDVMVDNARKQLQERFARIGQKALARLHEKRPDLQGKTLEETVILLKAEERLSRSPFLNSLDAPSDRHSLIVSDAAERRT